jgi:hypothetical protein
LAVAIKWLILDTRLQVLVPLQELDLYAITFVLTIYMIGFPVVTSRASRLPPRVFKKLSRRIVKIKAKRLLTEVRSAESHTQKRPS